MDNIIGVKKKSIDPHQSVLVIDAIFDLRLVPSTSLTTAR